MMTTDEDKVFFLTAVETFRVSELKHSYDAAKRRFQMWPESQATVKLSVSAFELVYWIGPEPLLDLAADSLKLTRDQKRKITVFEEWQRINRHSVIYVFDQLDHKTWTTIMPVERAEVWL